MAPIPSAFTFNIYEMRKKNFFPVRFMKKLVLKTARSTQNFQHFRKNVALKKAHLLHFTVAWFFFFLLQIFLLISTPTNSPTHTLFLKTCMILLLNFCTNSLKKFLKKENLKYSELKRSCYYANILAKYSNILRIKNCFKGLLKTFLWPKKAFPAILRLINQRHTRYVRTLTCQ